MSGNLRFPVTKYVLGMDIITSQAPCVNWCKAKWLNEFGETIGFNPWKQTTGGSVLYMCRGLAIPRDKIRFILNKVITLLAPGYPKTEVLIYKRVQFSGKPYRDLFRMIADEDFSSKYWRTRDNARVTVTSASFSDRKLVRLFQQLDDEGDPLWCDPVIELVDIPVPE